MEKSQMFSKANIQDILALTPMQEGMLFHYLSNPDSEQYLEQLSLTVSGKVDIIAIKEAWNTLASNNEMLRTVFRWNKLDKPLQIVLHEYELPFMELDISHYNASEKEDMLESIKKRDYTRRIDISSEPLRITAVKLEADKYELIVTYSHMLYDGWSNGILIKEFIEACNSIAKGKELVRVKKNRFKEFIKWSQKQDKDAQKEYWESYFKGYDERTVLSLGSPVEVYEGNKNMSYLLPEELSNRVYEFCKKEKTTMAAVLYTAWGILLQKYNNTKDIVFGTTVSGRNARVAGIEEIVGLFINTLPLRVSSHSNDSILSLLRKVDNAAKNNDEYQSTSLADIKTYSKIASKEELFDTLVVIENYPLDSIINDKDNQIKIEKFGMTEATNYKLTLGIVDFNGLKLEFSYDQSLFDADSINRMLGHFSSVIDCIVSKPEISINSIDILSAKEKHRILSEFNCTSVDYPKYNTINQIFEEQAAKTPDNIALIFEDKTLTYRELNQKANQLARTLRANGAKPDSLIGVMVERSIEMIVSIMAILKAGSGYLPVDTEYPQDRIQYMLEDSKAEILLTQSWMLDKIRFSGHKIMVDDEKSYAKDNSNLEQINRYNNLAYVIYTSGSTGKPKGILIEHFSVLNLVYSQQKEFKINETDRVLQFSTVCFDASVEQIFTSLLRGAALVLVSKERLLNTNEFEEYVAEKEVTHMHAVPAFLAKLRWRDSYKLRRVISGGDVCPVSLVDEWYKHCDFYNEYGPTETTVTSIELLMNDTAVKNSIGKPIANTRLYIVDNNNKICPIGVAGELCIAGDGLARGYLNRDELTLEKFVPNPFEKEGKMYRTGDLARWLSNGNIEFLGRIDNQVKIRGFRIELGEIESKLLEHTDIKEAVVLAKDDRSGNKNLCAYLLSDRQLNVKELREYLSQDLPDYMIPSYFIQLNKMPLTPSGKLDRKALPDPEGIIATGSEYEAPRNDTEEKLVEIWKEVLRVERIGINDDFFELGGHSLKATSLVAKIHKELNVEIPIKTIFRISTIKELSKYINGTEESIYSQIQPIEQSVSYEASSAQKRIYLLQQFNINSTSYNISGILEIEGELNRAKLENAFKVLINRHESLRTSFEQTEEGLIQKIHDQAEFELEEINAALLKNKAAVMKEISNSFIRAFDLSKAPLLRAALCELEHNKYMLIVDIHHIVSDGVSMDILVNELTQIYEDKPLNDLKIQYKDYAAWQNKLHKSERIKRQEEYWKEKFSGASGNAPVLNMPTDYPRPAIQSFEGDSIDLELNEDLTQGLKRIAKETGSTLYMVMLSAFNILLSKYTGQEDIVIGSPIAGRPHADLENIIGMFVNTLAMRNYPEQNKTIVKLIREVKENSLKVYENQDYQFEELVEKLNITRDVSRNPLFDMVFAMQNIEQTEVRLKDLYVKVYEADNKISKFDITFTAAETGEKIRLNIQYCTKLYKKDTIERMYGHLIKILRQTIENPEVQIKEIELVTPQEKQQIIIDFNDTDADYPRYKTIHQLFEEQAEQTPENTAVVCREQKLTYRELNEKANRLARVLRQEGIASDGIAAIMAERSAEMIVGIMAILKAGGAYLPIDPAYPKDRIEYMLQDSGAKVLLTQSWLAENVSIEGKILLLDKAEDYAYDGSNLDNINTSDNMAYIIYTSGTTGKPKGAIIEHKNVVRLMFNDKMQFDFNDTDVWTMFHSFCFDFSVWEMYGALLYGGKLVVVPKSVAQEPAEYLKLLRAEGVTVLNQTPTAFYNLLAEEVKAKEKDLSIRYIIFGGEALKPVMLKSWKERYPASRLINMYGITETTVHVTYKEITDYEIENNISNIGRPIPTLTTYIMDRNMKLLPIGVPGELYVGGEGVCRGYLNRPELTAEKFVPNPYNSNDRLYKSGDLAKLLPNGEMEYMGRIDHQVKIRGHRIELGEIESKLLSHSSIKETIVLVKQDESGYEYLCAYIVVNSESMYEDELTITDIREHLSKNLPDYMIPSYVVKLDKMPMTSNGKIDRKALPDPDESLRTGAEYEAPRNLIEEKLVSIWKNILHVNKIGINDNFFELGGHSFKATVMAVKLHKELNVEVPLHQIFNRPTIKDLAEYINKSEKSSYLEIKQVEPKEYYEMSSAQNRMYLVQQQSPYSVSYNIPGILMLEGALDKDKLEAVFKKLIERHESFRTCFVQSDGIIVQKILKEVEFAIQHFKTDSEENIEKIFHEFVKPFDLSKAPLIRIGLVEVCNDACTPRNILIYDMHHIISDGVSIQILIQEFTAIYEGIELPALRVQYKDYAEWHNKMLLSDSMKRQEEFWMREFEASVQELTLPIDHQRPSIQSFEGDYINVEIDEETTESLRKLCKDTGTTMYMMLLASFNVLMSKCSMQEDIVVGSPIAGRPHADLENIIGIFINTLAIRCFPQGNKTFKEFLEEVKRKCLEVYENQDYQFNDLIEKLGIRRGTNRNPLFDVMFALQNTQAGKQYDGSIKIKPYNIESKVSKFDLTLFAVEVEKSLELSFEFSTVLFKKSTVEKIIQSYKEILNKIIENPDIKLNSIQPMSSFAVAKAVEEDEVDFDF